MTTLKRQPDGSTIVGRHKVVTTDGEQLFNSTIPTNGTAPASASAAGVTGTIAWDASYIYICTDTDTWMRAAIATWV